MIHYFRCANANLNLRVRLARGSDHPAVLLADGGMAAGGASG